MSVNMSVCPLSYAQSVRGSDVCVISEVVCIYKADFWCPQSLSEYGCKQLCVCCGGGGSWGSLSWSVCAESFCMWSELDVNFPCSEERGTAGITKSTQDLNSFSKCFLNT